MLCQDCFDPFLAVMTECLVVRKATWSFGFYSGIGLGIGQGYVRRTSQMSHPWGCSQRGKHGRGRHSIRPWRLGRASRASSVSSLGMRRLRHLAGDLVTKKKKKAE